MGKIKFKKPDIKGCFGKLKSLKWADMKNGIRAMKKRQGGKGSGIPQQPLCTKNAEAVSLYEPLFTDFARHLGNRHQLSDRGNVPSFCGGGNFVFACFHEGISV